jgi:predicted ATPase/class 3 adenylate cyclase
MADMPSGTVTFVFTDIEGSTRLWEEHPDTMRDALRRHDDLMRGAIAPNGGYVVKTRGDGFHAAFTTAHDAIAAVVQAQQALAAEPWGATGRLAARVGVHTGEAEYRDGDYFGTAPNRAARLAAAGHGGQILVSGVTASLVGDGLPGDVDLVLLGEFLLRDVPEPMTVFQVVAPGLVRDFPPLSTADTVPGNLPAPVSSFVGRADEVGDVADLLARSRIVTLTGVGGVGKTRLALQVAAEVRPRFRHGAWLVELGKVREPGAVADAVAAAVGAPNRAGSPVPTVLVDFLRAKELLLVLDNCEHLLAPTADLVRTLEQACPGLVVLATSREGLGVRGEQLVAVRSLTEDEATRLFVDRAAEAHTGFEVTDANAAAINEVCRRLDGIPLAIELAAARVTSLSPAQLAQRLDQRFRILAGGERGAVERHATLRAAIDWSYDLLTEAEQRLLARLSVFAGGCTLEAAEAVCADTELPRAEVLDHLTSLVARSLVRFDPTDEALPWYRMLETIRQYAEERLDDRERDDVRDRHAGYYAEFLPVAVAGARGPEQAQWLQRVERDTENVRVAIEWAVSQRDAPLVVELMQAGTMAPLSLRPCGTALFEHAEDALEIVREGAPDQLPLMRSLASVAAFGRGDHQRARELADDALAAPGGPDRDDVYGSWSTRNSLAMMAGDMAGAREELAHLVARGRRIGDAYELAAALAGYASVGHFVDRVDDGIAYADEALATARRAGAPTVMAMALAARALLAIDRDREVARESVLEAADLYASLGPSGADEQTVAMILMTTQRLGMARTSLDAAATILDRTPSSPLLLCGVLEDLAATIAADRPEEAAVLLGAVDAFAPGFADLSDFAGTRERVNRDLAERLDAGSIAALRTRGARMTPDKATDYARALVDEVRAELSR